MTNKIKKPELFFKYLLFVFGIIILSCSNNNNDETKKNNSNATKPIPVRVKVIEPREFKKEIVFYSKLSGIVENTKTSPVSGHIEKILVKPGQYVKERQIVLQFPSDNPSLQYQQAKVAYENLTKTYNRFKELLKAGETSQQNFDNIESQYLVAKRNYEAIKQLIYVEAPISGIVSNIAVTEGQQIDAGKPLFTISVLNKVRAVGYANEKEIQELKVGMTGTILWNDKTYACKIVSIALKMDDASKGFRVEFEANNPHLELKSGVTVEIRVPYYSNPKAIVVPKSLLLEDSDGKYFVFVEEEGLAKKRIVKVGKTSGVDVEVLSGLNFGEKLIIEGYHLLSENSKVYIVEN
ncbi:MAG: efflux RND transporter periplasmic adaptor subunit [Ignavibacteria bacterium]|nr:efflux RND transporter periplasmic adaptor subunit [Ignavibacteria bacterium]